MGRNGEHPVNLTSSIGGAFADPAWSPDGIEIAFIRLRGNILDEELYIMNSDGTNPVVLTKATGFGGSRPSWSPDGTKIAFARVGSIEGGIGWAIATIERDGSDLLMLTPIGTNEAPAWSPYPIERF